MGYHLNFVLNKWMFKQIFIAKYTIVIQKYLHCYDGSLTV